jgi:hypothetical protein
LHLGEGTVTTITVMSPEISRIRGSIGHIFGRSIHGLQAQAVQKRPRRLFGREGTTDTMEQLNDGPRP